MGAILSGGGEFTLEISDVVLDIGAHIGINLPVYHKRGCSMVVAVEPDVSSFHLLERNARYVLDLKRKMRIITLRTAVVNNEGTRGVLNIHPTISARHTMSAPRARHIPFEKCIVPTTSLNSLLCEYTGVTVVKVDIQGSEREVILGVTDWKLVRLLVVEYDFEYAPFVADYYRFLKEMKKFFPTTDAKEVESNDVGKYKHYPTGVVIRMKRVNIDTQIYRCL